MNLGIAGRRAMVTGASKGIGRAVAEALAAEGCAVTLVARNAEALAATAEAIRTQHNVPVRWRAADLADVAVHAALAEAEPDADILVNNAGAVPPGSIQSLGPEAVAEGWRLKVFGYLGLMHVFYPRMAARGRGVIINVIGLAGQRVNADLIALSGGNAALIAMTRALGAAGPASGVRVVGVNPSATATDRAIALWRAQAERTFGDAGRWAELLGSLPFGRAATPQEIADAVTFLASDRASYISGTVLNVDGGLNARP